MQELGHLREQAFARERVIGFRKQLLLALRLALLQQLLALLLDHLEQVDLVVLLVGVVLVLVGR